MRGNGWNRKLLINKEIKRYVEMARAGSRTSSTQKKDQ